MTCEEVQRTVRESNGAENIPEQVRERIFHHVQECKDCQEFGRSNVERMIEEGTMPSPERAQELVELAIRDRFVFTSRTN